MNPTKDPKDARPRPAKGWKRRVLAASALAALALALLPPPAAADHLAPACFDGHDGLHLFPLTGAGATITFDNSVPAPYGGKTVDVELAGPTLVMATVINNTHMATEIIEMDLVGVDPDIGPIEIAEHRVVASTGMVVAGASSCFPATSTFDVYIQVNAPLPAHTDDPKVMTTTLDAIPPSGGTIYTDPSIIDIFSGPLHDPGESHVAILYNADHTPTPECIDGEDNDGDGDVDFPLDPDCDSPVDNTESAPLPECADGEDNDGDGFTDYPDDPGCTSLSDDSEGSDGGSGTGVGGFYVTGQGGQAAGSAAASALPLALVALAVLAMRARDSGK